MFGYDTVRDPPIATFVHDFSLLGPGLTTRGLKSSSHLSSTIEVRTVSFSCFRLL